MAYHMATENKNWSVLSITDFLIIFSMLNAVTIVFTNFSGTPAQQDYSFLTGKWNDDY
jgi:hypothetical protein